MTPVLELKNIEKSYYGNPVLKGISYSVMPGEIRGVIGENGAGKSTMMNIIFGMPVIHHTGGFKGEVLVNGRPANIMSPRDAMDFGIGMVHQEFMLIPEMAVFENIKLNREVTKKTWFLSALSRKLEVLDIAKMRLQARAALKKVGMDIDEFLPVAGLPVGHMQFIEIAREIDHPNLKLIVFDEPTAVLTEVEALVFLKTMTHLAKDFGIGMLFISHRLDEIKEVCDTVTILRDGEQVGNYQTGEVSAARMAELMVGHKVSIDVKCRVPQRLKDSEIVLELKNFCVDMPGEHVKGIDLKVRRGEVLGIAGLAGQGKLGIANGIMGICQASGEVRKDGKVLLLNSPLHMLKNKIAFLSEDRRGAGLLLDESLEDNICFTACYVFGEFLHTGILRFLALLDRKKAERFADKMIGELDIRCVGKKQITRRLSGGNQQKVCIVRTLACQPDVLLVSEPTRGIDIGAKKLILDKLLELADAGMTILVASSELVELRAIADRIVVVAEGVVAGEFFPDASDADIGLAMAS